MIEDVPEYVIGFGFGLALGVAFLSGGIEEVLTALWWVPMIEKESGV